MVNKVDGLIGTLKNTGFFSVFMSNIFSKILSFFGGVIIVRILSKNDYGLYTYVMNCYSMLFILNDFGCNVAMIQFRSENHKNTKLYNGYFIFPFKCALLFSVVASILLVISPLFFPFKQEDAQVLTQCLFLLPVFTTINTFLQSNLRVEMQNKKFAILNVLQVVFHYGYILPMSFLGGIRGAVVSNYAVAISVLLMSVMISRKFLRFDWREKTLDSKHKKHFLKYAFASQLNNSIGALLNLFDVFLIGVVIADNEVISSYKVASTIPQALLFIPNSILIYAGPLFARNIGNKTWIRRNFNRMVAGCIAVNGMISLMCILLAQSIITYIFGNEYSDAVSCFNILMISFFLQGTFQIPSANIIYTQHKVRMNIAITIVSNILNCILDVWLIHYYGSIGAAIATLLVSSVTSIMAYGYMRFWLRAKD